LLVAFLEDWTISSEILKLKVLEDVQRLSREGVHSSEWKWKASLMDDDIV